MSSENTDRTTLGILPAIVPFSVPIVALLFGMLIGGTIGWSAREDRGLSSVIKRPSALRGCELVVQDQRTELSELREQVAAQQRELEKLRREAR